MNRLLLATALASVASAAMAAPAISPAARVDFERDIRPILSDACFACHGPDANTRQADLRLDTREGAFADRGGYRLIVPGNAAESRLYQRMSHSDAVARMPPPAAERRPAPEQIETVRRWINEGAEWSSHWAYEAPDRPSVPEVATGNRPLNEIDAFVTARLRQEGLELAAESDKRTLLRRLTLDLTGLPPEPADVERFLSDTSPHAYEREVDRLLNSPHYGERMALQWLDLSRYADTHGFHIDGRRDMWHWRDWVIRSFNENKPFDEFTIEQIAGDLLPEPTVEQKIATGFNRNHMINHEGGAIAAEYHTEYVVDRVETVSTVWMAMTMGCARCHDHKYDPIKQREFYEFYAFFNSVDELGLDGVNGNAVPMLRLPDSKQEDQLSELDQAIRSLQADLPHARISRQIADWEATAMATIPRADQSGLEAHYEMEGGFSDSSGNYRHGRVMRGEPLFRSANAGQGASFDVDTHVAFPGTTTLDVSRPFTIAFWIRHAGLVEKSLLHKMDDPESRTGLELRLSRPVSIPDTLRREYELTIRLSASEDDGIVLKPENPLRNQRGIDPSYHIAISYDGSGTAAGFRIHLNGEQVATAVLQDSLTGSPEAGAPFEIGAGRFGGRYTGTLDDLRIYPRVLDASEIATIRTHEPVAALLAGPYIDCASVLADAPAKPADDIYAPKPDTAVSRCRNRSSVLKDYYLTHAAPETDRQLYARLQELQAERARVEKQVPNVMVMRELPAPRETYMLGRGDYRNRSESVSPRTPDWLSPFPADAPRNRLGLARWIASPDHPLTARVAVNHYWQSYFGHGLVRTAEDFGMQGELPTHPQLLDWLAVEFTDSGWDIKALQKKIVMSATYRQSSRLSPALQSRDPENRLLARGPRYRLPAESVRDNALLTAGLLDRRIGGPSVFPYQPDGLWREMAYGDMFTAQVYRQGSGADLYRRSMYTFWKRTIPPPSLAVFDAPDREKCIATRSRTNTPLQALVLLNDPTYVEASRALAETMLREGGSTPQDRLRSAYSRTLGRPPSEVETRLLGQLAQEQAAKFRNAPQQARDLLQVGELRADPSFDPAELAAWTVVASSILNLDETISKE